MRQRNSLCGRDHPGDDKDGIDTALFELAKDALIKAVMIATDIAATHMVCAAGYLAATWFIAKSVIDDAGPDQMRQLQRDIPKLLDDLELVFSWPRRPTTGKPIMEDMLTTSYVQRLARKEAEEHAHRGVFAFCKESRSLIDLYAKNLKRHAHIVLAVDGDNQVLQRKGTDEDPDSYPAHVNYSLYHILRSHSLFMGAHKTGEQSENTKFGCNVRLRLRDKSIKMNGYVVFDVLFTANSSSDAEWQEADLQVPLREGAKSLDFYQEDESVPGKADTMTISDNDGTSHTESRLDRSRLVQPGALCDLVKAPIGSRICCRIHDNKLYQLYEGVPLKQHIVPGSSISLRQVMQQYKLSSRMKLVLAFVVARSFWQYYDSPWMDAGWSSDSIHFLREVSPGQKDADDGEDDDDGGSVRSVASSALSSTEGALFASRPYLAIDFNAEKPKKVMEYCNSYSVIYRFPRLLALCVMLAEIADGKTFTTKDEGSFEANLNAAWTKTRRNVKPNRVRNDFDFPDYRKAILDCLNYKPDDRESTAATTSPEADKSARKAFVYTAVVQPLEQLLRSLGFLDALHIMDPIDMPRKPNRVVKLSDSVPSSLAAQDQWGASCQGSIRWLDDISSVNRSIRDLGRIRASGSHFRPVRVAVLDTGYDSEAVFFTLDSRKRRIKGWKDFNEWSEVPTDTSGHGTHTLSLVMKVAPTANLYVARVAKDHASLHDAADDINKAIEWAAGECTADVIVMAFGFPNKIPSISRAIVKAQLKRNDQLIFLAAASNSGANRRETFPATLHNVISIRETNHHGAFSDSNPPVDSHGPIVFGTLGRDVPSAWLRSFAGEVPKSGSSVATAVAAGLVAMILEFVSIGVNGSQANFPSDIRQVWTTEGIIAALTRMSHDMGNRSYFISPLSFFSSKDMTKSWNAISDAVIG